MKRLGVFLVVASLCFVAGRLSHKQAAKAEGGDGAGVPPPCQDINGDGLSNLSDAVYFLQWRFRGGPAPECAHPTGAGFPDTGQTTCYDELGRAIRCDSTTYPGQDGFYRTGCPETNRFMDNGDGTVTDTCTGLMWQKDSENDGSLDWGDSLRYCKNLTLAGYRDWRVPNVRELQSIVDYGRFEPSIDPVFGVADTTDVFYWSSTTNVLRDDGAWFVDFENGLVDFDEKDAPLYSVRAVRGGLTRR